ncbi:MAG: S8 family peptidase [Planctomycetota bacterium]
MFRYKPELIRFVMFAIFASTVLAVPVQYRSHEKSIHRPHHLSNEIIVKFKDRTPAEMGRSVCNKHGCHILKTSRFAGFHRVRIPAGKLPEHVAEKFRQNPNVEYAEVNAYAYAMFTPNDPLYSLQWHFNHPTGGINIEPAWDITFGDPNVIIAVVDTGVAYENDKNFQQAPDLASTNFVPGYDFVRNDTHPNDDDGHGTHVAGTIAQSTHNAYGPAGGAFNCSIMPVKVLDRRGEAPYSDIADGIYFAANNGAHVINLSLGGTVNSTTLRDAVKYAYQQGVTVVCAAGNEYQDGNPASYPAAYDDYCIAVGATRIDRGRAPYSNTGSYLDLVAPGGDMDVDQNNDGGKVTAFDWYLFEGTSMAAPHVSAVAGLLASVGVTDPDAIRQALEGSAIDLSAPGWDAEYGWGLIDAHAALLYYPRRGDYNADGDTDLGDVLMFMDSWLAANPLIDTAPGGGNGIVDLYDFAVLSAHWQQP